MGLTVGRVLAFLAALSASAASAQPALYPDRQFDAGLGPLTDIAFSPDGRLLAAAAASGSVGIWDAQTGSAIRTARVSASRLTRIAFDHQGHLLGAAAEDGGVYLLDLRSGRIVEAARHDRAATSLAFSPDGLMAASGDAAGDILLWNPSGGVIGPLRQEGHWKGILFLAFAAPGTLVSLSEDLQVITWDARGRRPVRRSTLRLESFGKTAVPEAVSLEAGRALLAVSAQHRMVPRGGALTGRGGMARPDDLKRVNVIVPYAVDTGISKDPIQCGDFLAERLTLAPGGCFAFSSSFQMKQPRLHVWDLVEQGADLQRLDLEARPAALALEPGGRALALAFDMGWVRTYRVSGAGASDCETRRTKGAPPAAGEPRIALGAETTPLIPPGAGYRLAVLGFEAGGVEAYMAEAVGEMIAGELSNSRHVQVLERGKIDAIVKEMEIQRSGLTTEDAVRIGRGLNARKVVFGSVRRFGEGTFVILARMVDVETQRVEGTRQVTCESCGEKDLPRAVQALSRAIVP